MADTNTARLCEQIVHAHFGPLTAKVVSVLLARGRMPVAQIARYTQLKPRTARACVLVLVQHNILWHAELADDGEVLEVNTEECLLRLRYGGYVLQTEQLFGKAASEILELVLDHGKLRPPDIIARASVYDPKSSTTYEQALHKLVVSRYLKASTVLSHVSPRDKLIQYEAEEKAKISGFLSAKQLREARELANARIKREETEAEKIGMKQKSTNPSHRKSSKHKTGDETVVDDDVFFRVNHDRFRVHIRNKLIVSAASERLNEAAGRVMRATLQATEERQLGISEAISDPTSLVNIADQLADEDDLSSGLIVTSASRPSTMTLLKEYLGILSSADNPTAAGHAASFISFNNSKVQVEFEIIARRLRQQVLEGLTRERYGDEGVRVIRLLLTMGKIDEKQIGKIAMMAAKDIRPLLSAMSADSLISIQEVPRSADRNPSRTFYLWYVDLQKTYSVLLGYLYKTLSNILQRKQAEQDEPTVKAVLEKRQRTDVSVDEGLLTRNEREILSEWESKRERLTVLEMRAEEAVFILKDLGTLSKNDD